MESFFLNPYPRAILHIDGDSFFASCEVARNPALKGKPVITGKERGIASAMTYEAKARGVTRGMRFFEIKKVCPEAIFLESDYDTYILYSERMCNIVKRYTSEIDKSGIDECFADITGLCEMLGMSYEKIAEMIKYDLYKELGMTFSVGLAPTKVLAKAASKWAKPSGLTFMPFGKINEFLVKLPIEDVWGIGPQTSTLLKKYGVKTAYDFVCKEKSWVVQYLSKPYFETWQELRGAVIFEFNTDQKHVFKSISNTRTFTPPSKDKSYIFSKLSENIENACIKARHNKLSTPQVRFFLKTQDFKYYEMEVKLPQVVSAPQEIIRAIEKSFNNIYKPNILYRATGITLEKLIEGDQIQLNLFGEDVCCQKTKIICDFIDSLSAKFGKQVVYLGSSSQAMIGPSNEGNRPSKVEVTPDLFQDETDLKRLGIPMLGEAV